MKSEFAAYREQLDLVDAEFFQIDHCDTMVAKVYRVDQPLKQPQILKIFSSGEEYHRELYFLNNLAGSLPVPQVLDAIDPGVDLDGAILMEYLPGQLIQEGDWSDDLAYEIGSTLAQLHLNRAEGYGDLIKQQSLTSDPNLYFGKKFKEELAECADHLPSEWVDRCCRYYAANQHLLQCVDGPCMIHRDFRPGNIIVYSGKLQGVIDWASARSGFAEQDFCSIEQMKWPCNKSYQEVLLAGYAAIRPVPNYSVIAPLLQLGRALSVVGFTLKSKTWNGRNRDLYKLNRDFLDRFNFSFEQRPVD